MSIVNLFKYVVGLIPKVDLQHLMQPEYSLAESHVINAASVIVMSRERKLV